jgi:hypothetical protein
VSPPDAAARRWLPAAVFGLVLVAQLFLVARLGTDIPFQDQWDVEGRLTYPAWRDGTWHAADLWRPHNEHRILWTRLENLALFSANGQWDPLVQLAVNALWRAAGAELLAWLLARGAGSLPGLLLGAGVVVAYLPHLAWVNALWGFQSSVYFVILFSLLALALLGDPGRSPPRLAAGLAAGVAALLALGAGAFVPVALLVLAGLHAAERRKFDPAAWRLAWPGLALLALAWGLRTPVPATAALHAATAGQFFNALGRALAWPHTAMPWAALALNLPLLLAVGSRLAGRRRAAAGEDVVLLIGGWAAAAAGAMAWSRGGGGEFDAGVTIRYVDFLLLLPLANAWCLVALVREAGEPRRRFARVLVGAWGVFLLVGWLGISAQVVRGFILPRMRDRDAPVRLAVAFQQSNDPAVFAGQHPILVPHPRLASVRFVLSDPRMRGALPPSFQPDRPMGPLSRAVRWLLGRQ